MIDPTTAQNDRLRDTGRWGYTGDMIEDSRPAPESGGVNRAFLWVALIVLAVIVAIALLGPQMGTGTVAP